MTYSAILTKFAETYPEILTNPEKYLGPNFEQVLDFWKHIEGLSDDEKDEMNDRYQALDNDLQRSASEAAYVAANDVVGVEFSCDASYVAWNVAGCSVFDSATRELIGDVKNKVFYDLIMTYKKD